MDRDELARQYAADGSFRQLGLRHGVSPQTVKKWLIEAGIEVHGTRPATRPDLSRYDKATWQEMYDEAQSVRELARRLGRDVAAVRYHLKRVGVATKRTGFKSPRTVPTPVGDQHYNWKGGVITHSSGYVLEYAPWHPAAKSAKGYVLQHRLVMERSLGRYLTRHELVHHKNEVKTDNRLENLEIMNRSIHMAHHKEDFPRDLAGRFTVE